MNILVIKLGAFGDFIQGLGAMKAIRHHHQNAHITLLTTKPFADLAKRCGYFDTVQIDTKPRWINPSAWLRLRRWFNTQNFARVYDLQNSDRTAFYFSLFRPKPEWVGIAKGASHRNTDPNRTKKHGFAALCDTLALADIYDVEPDDLRWMEADTARFALTQPYALIISGSAANRPEKRWPAKHFAALCDHLARAGIQPVLIGTEADTQATEQIITLAQTKSILDLTGKTAMDDLPALARGAVVAIGNDTGPMHMIAATGCQSLVLFNLKSSRPEKHAPIGAQVSTMASKGIENITVETVMDKIKIT